MEKTSMSLDEIEEKLKGNRHALIQLWENSKQQEKIDKLKAEEFREALDKARAGTIDWGYHQLHRIKNSSNPFINKKEIIEAAELFFKHWLKEDMPYDALKIAYQYGLGLEFLQRAAEYLVDSIICKPGYDRSPGIAVIRKGWIKNEKLIRAYFQDTYKEFLSRNCTDLLPLITEFPQYFNEEQKEIAAALGVSSSPILVREFWEEYP